jgi:hypothetical protein
MEQVERELQEIWLKRRHIQRDIERRKVSQANNEEVPYLYCIDSCYSSM